MKKINTYIIEKLHLNKDTKIDNTFKVGDPVCTVWFEDFEDEDTGNINTIIRVTVESFNFSSIKENKDGKTYDLALSSTYMKGKNQVITHFDIFINNNGYYETTNYCQLFLTFPDAKLLLDDMVYCSFEDFTEKEIFKYFEGKDKKKLFANGAKIIYSEPKDVKKMIRKVNAKLK